MSAATSRFVAAGRRTFRRSAPRARRIPSTTSETNFAGEAIGVVGRSRNGAGPGDGDHLQRRPAERARPTGSRWPAVLVRSPPGQPRTSTGCRRTRLCPAPASTIPAHNRIERSREIVGRRGQVVDVVVDNMHDPPARIPEAAGRRASRRDAARLPLTCRRRRVAQRCR